MTDREWDGVVGRITANWPHQLPPQVALEKWRRDLDDLPSEQVNVAVESLYREGREWPPNGAQIRKQAVELASDIPTWGEVWDRLWQAAQRFGQRREEEALAWLAEWSPLAAAFARRLPFREFCATEEPEVFHGQARRIWEQSVSRYERDSALHGLPDAGLRAVERANSQPTEFGRVLERTVGELGPADDETRGAA